MGNSTGSGSGGGSSVNIETLNIEVNSTGAQEAVDSLNAIERATVKVVDQTDNLGRAARQTDQAQRNAAQGTRQQAAALEEANTRVTEANRLAAENAKVTQAQIDKGAAYLAQLREQVSTYGMSSTELMRYRANQLGVGDAAEKNIRTLEELGTSGSRSSLRFGEALDQVRLSSSRVRTELVVLGHEALAGRFSRIPASMMVMAEYSNLSAVAMSAVGLSVIGVVGALAAFIVQVSHGQTQIKEFNDALTRTNGVSGETIGSLKELADTVGKLHGNYAFAYEAAAKLAGSGKFTADQIALILPAVEGINHAFGTPLQDSIRQFETLVVHGTRAGAAGTYEVTKAIEALNEQYHFLTASQMEHIIQLEHEGKSQDASTYAIKLFTDEGNRAAKESEKYMSYMTKRWNELGQAIANAKNFLASFGRASTNTEAVTKFAESVATTQKALQDPSLGAGERAGMEKKLAQQKRDLDFAQAGSEVDRRTAEVKAKNQQTNDEATRALAVRAQEDMHLMKKTGDDLKAALSKFHNENDVIEAANPGYKDQNSKYLADREAAIIKQHSSKDARTKAYKDGSDQLLRMEEEDYQHEFKLAQQAAQQQERIAQEQHRAGAIEDKAYYDILRKGQDDQLRALDSSHEKQLASLQKFTTKTAVERARIQKQISEVNNAYETQKNTIQNKLDEINLEQQLDTQKKIKDIMEAVTKEGVKETEETERQIDVVKRHNEEIGKSAAERRLAAEATSQQTIKQNELDAAYLQTLIDSGKFDDSTVAVFTARKTWLDRAVDDQKRLNTEIERGADLEQKLAEQDRFRALSSRIGDSLADAIVDGGMKGVKKLIVDMEHEFAKAILRPILQPLAEGLAGIIAPMVGLSGANGLTAAGALGSAGAAANLAASANALYNLVSNGAGMGIGSLVGIGGGLAGNAGVSAFGAGMGMSSAQAAQAAAIYNQAGMGSIASSLTGGSIAGMFANGITGFLGGNALGNVLSFGQGSKGVVNAGSIAGSIVGSLVPGLGTAIGGIIGGSLGGLVNGLFGHGKPEFKGAGIRGYATDTGVVGESYTKYHRSGGLFVGSKNYEERGGIDTQIVNTITGTIGQMKSASSTFAHNIGVSSNVLDNYRKDFDVKFTKDEEANKQAMTDFLSSIGDDIATKLVPNISNFSRSGETASTTLQRLSDVFAATNVIAGLMGKTITEAFGSADLSSYNARQHLVDFAGGVDQLASMVTAYSQGFLTDSEKLVPLQRSVRDAMTELGYGTVTTKDQFKALVSSLNLTDEGSAQLYINLMKIAPGFLEVSNGIQAALDAVTKAESDYKNAQSTAAEQYQGFVNAVTESTSALSDARKQIVQNYRDAVDAQNQARSDITDSYVQASQQVMDVQQKMADSMRALASTITDFINQLLGSDASGTTASQQKSALEAQFAIATAQAQSGDQAAGAKLPQLAQSLLDINKSTAKDSVEYRRSVGTVTNKLAHLSTDLTTKANKLAPATTPQDELQTALDNQKKWADAVVASGASFTKASEDILAGYKTASSAVELWSRMVVGSESDLSQSTDKILESANDLWKQYYDARMAWDGARFQLDQANAIRNNIELHQITALEQFTQAIQDVGTTLKTLLQARADAAAITQPAPPPPPPPPPVQVAPAAPAVAVPAAEVYTPPPAPAPAPAAAPAPFSNRGIGGSSEPAGGFTLRNDPLVDWSGYGRMDSEGRVQDYVIRNGEAIYPYASGGAFADGVVRRPTMFNASQMGENGPEAIMPLTNVGGSLGVRTAGVSNKEVVSLLKELIAKVSEANLDRRVGDGGVVAQTSKLYKLLNNLSPEGDTLQVRVVAS